MRNSPPWPPRWAHLTPEQLAEGFIQIAVANMAQAIRQISVQKGLNPADFALVCFGGAGGQHACAVADELGMDRVFIHPLRRGVVGLWHRPVRFLAAARAGGGTALHPAGHARRWRKPPRVWPPRPKPRCARKTPAPPSPTPPPSCCATPGRTPPCPLNSANSTRWRGNLPPRISACSASSRPEKPLVAETVLVEASTPGETLAEPEIAASPLPAPLETARIVHRRPGA